MGTNIQRLLAILAYTDFGDRGDSLGNRLDALESLACELFGAGAFTAFQAVRREASTPMR